MSPQYDILIRNAHLRDRNSSSFDIGVTNGSIVAIEKHLAGTSSNEIDAMGNLVSEAFANPHLHLCKVWTLSMMNDDTLGAYQDNGMAKSINAIEMAANIKSKYASSWIASNARKAVAMAALHGNLHIRAFADVDSKAKLEGIKALLQVREEFKGVVDIQVVAFPQDGIVKEPGTLELLRESIQLGADVIGGIPWIEITEEDASEHIKLVFDLAQEFNLDISMLLDDAGDPGLRTLEMMATQAIKRSWEGRCLAHHCRAMSLYPAPYFQKLLTLLKQARVPIVSDPHTGPLHAKVQELYEANVTVCLGQDDISDAYYPFGRNSMLEVAFLAAHMLWMTNSHEIEHLYEMITRKALTAMNLDFHLTIGAPAHLVVLSVPSVVEALRHHDAPTHVISHGKIVNRSEMEAIASAQVQLAT